MLSLTSLVSKDGQLSQRVCVNGNFSPAHQFSNKHSKTYSNYKTLPCGSGILQTSSYLEMNPFLLLDILPQGLWFITLHVACL